MLWRQIENIFKTLKGSTAAATGKPFRVFLSQIMSKLKSINTSIWSDPWFESISNEAKLLFLYLITNDHNNMLGIYELSIRKISFETGISKDIVEEELKMFEEAGKIKYRENYIILINFLKHQKFNGNMKKSAIDVHNLLPETLRINGLHLDREKTEQSFLTLSEGFAKPLGMVRKVEVEVEDEKEIELECDFSNTLQEKSFNDLTRDSYFPVEKLADVYLKDEKLSSLVAKHTNKSIDDLKNLMPQYVEKLKTENRGVETPGEFAKYFKNILKGNFKIDTPPPKLNSSEEYCWQWKGLPKKYGSKQQYESDKKNWDQPGFGFKTLKTPNNGQRYQRL